MSYWHTWETRDPELTSPYGDNNPPVGSGSDRDTSRQLEVGRTYTDKKGLEWECIFVRDGIAWMMNNNNTAYKWHSDTGINISQGGGEYNIEFPETRHGTVDYFNGKPDFNTWKEDE